jgi:glucan 1,3-beta-glucosidase
VRDVTGTGEGKGPLISLHEGFLGLDQWAGFLPNADRVALDLHPYLCFGPQSSATIDTYRNTPCQNWGGMVNTSMSAFGLTGAGEWSNAVTDCGLWLNGVNLGVRYDGTFISETHARIGDCAVWTDWQNYDQTMKTGLMNFAMASMDALQVCNFTGAAFSPAQPLLDTKQNWFFWTWKIGNSSVTGKVETPAWSYKLGLDNGWMPKDPRSAVGVCDSTAPWQPPLQAWQTGGAGAGQIAPAATASFAWPPPTISGGGAAGALPSYTPTGPVPTLPGPTFSFTQTGARATPSVGNGWANAADTAGAMVPIAGCNYLDTWVGAGAPPSPLCS